LPNDCGKSTLALQIDHNQRRQGRCGLLLVRHDRSGTPTIFSRMRLARGAVEVHETINLCTLVHQHWARGVRVDYLIVDEAQFVSPTQVDQLAELVDELHAIQVEVLCRCGLPGRFKSRIHDDQVVRDGSTVLVADTDPTDEVRYQVLCRKHYRNGNLGPSTIPGEQLRLA
jgi:thymidine kinase